MDHANKEITKKNKQKKNLILKTLILIQLELCGLISATA